MQKEMEQYIELWRHGMEKSDVFQKGVAEGQNPVHLSKALAKLPDRKAIEAFSRPNNFLIAYLAILYALSLAGVIGSLGLIQSLPIPWLITFFLLSLAVTGAILFFLAKRKAFAYQAVGALFFMELGTSLDQDAMALAVLIALYSPVVVLCIYLKVKHYPHQELGGLMKSDDGQYVYE